MSKLSVGDIMPVFSLPALDGSQFDLSDVRGKRVIFTFFRFSSCPFCNVRIDRIVKRWGEFADDTVMVGVFDADIGDLSKRMGKRDIPFTILADGDYELFARHGVEKSFFRFMWGALRSPMTFLRASLNGYFPMTLSISKMSTIPVDILIGEDGKVVEAHYCKDTADHLPVDKLIRFSKGE